MRRAWRVLSSLAIAVGLAGCAAATSGRGSDQVAWETTDVRQRLEESGTRMRWDYTLVLRNRGATAITFEQMELGVRAAGSVDDIWGGMETRPFTRTLDPNGEMRVARSDSWGCPRCGPGDMPRFFADGIVRFITFTGRDAQGQPLKVNVRIPLHSGVGTRQ
jgi:hypothetical protein